MLNLTTKGPLTPIDLASRWTLNECFFPSISRCKVSIPESDPETTQISIYFENRPQEALVTIVHGEQPRILSGERGEALVSRADLDYQERVNIKYTVDKIVEFGEQVKQVGVFSYSLSDFLSFVWHYPIAVMIDFKEGFSQNFAPASALLGLLKVYLSEEDLHLLEVATRNLYREDRIVYQSSQKIIKALKGATCVKIDNSHGDVDHYIWISSLGDRVGKAFVRRGADTPALWIKDNCFKISPEELSSLVVKSVSFAGDPHSREVERRIADYRANPSRLTHP